jgi:hypothetical protein
MDARMKAIESGNRYRSKSYKVGLITNMKLFFLLSAATRINTFIFSFQRFKNFKFEFFKNFRYTASYFAIRFYFFPILFNFISLLFKILFYFLFI